MAGRLDKTGKPYKFRYVVLSVAILLLLAAALIYGLADPAASGFFPRCGFKVVTGYDCPGCGSQRALHALLHGDISSAFHFNAFMVILLPVIFIMMAGEFLRVFYPSIISSSKVLSRVERLFGSRYFILAIGVTAIIWWILRNII